MIFPKLLIQEGSRSPSRIHWAVDILIKQHEEPEGTDRLLNFLLNYWNDSVNPMKTDEARKRLLDTESLLEEVETDSNCFPELVDKGEYSVKFLILFAKLLMMQGKTKRKDTCMFRNLLEKLKAHKDIFSIVRTATHGKKYA